MKPNDKVKESPYLLIDQGHYKERRKPVDGAVYETILDQMYLTYKFYQYYLRTYQI